MYSLLFSLLVLFTSTIPQAHATCSTYCKPGVSRACGQGCVSIYRQCHKPTTTACNGERPASAKPHFDNPTHVEPKPVISSQPKGG